MQTCRDNGREDRFGIWENEKEGVMEDINKIRCRFEHRALRDFYFDDPEHFAEVLLYKPDSLYWIMRIFYRENGSKIPYRPEQVSAGLVKMSDGTCAVKISLPEPEEGTLCYRIYAFLDPEHTRKGYFCIERCKVGDADHVYVGQWHYFGKKCAHLGYAGRPATQEEEFRLCAEYYETFEPEMLSGLIEECVKDRRGRKIAEGI